MTQDTLSSTGRFESSPEEAKEEGKSVIAPTSAVDSFDKDCVGVVLVLLNDGQGDNESKRRPNIEEGVILL
jgi:hypothetical protein